MTQFCVLFVAFLLHATTAIVYNVWSADSKGFNNHETGFAYSLDHYVKNVSKYFSDDSQFHFKTGHHYLNTDLVIQNASNVTLIGERLCIIRCTSHVGISILSVTNFRLENITFQHCITRYGDHLHIDLRHSFTSNSKPGNDTSILIHNCMSVEIINIRIIITEGNIGLLFANVLKCSKIAYVHIIKTNCRRSENDISSPADGILLYYDNNPSNVSSEVYLNNFKFKTNGSCLHSTYYAITLLIFQKNVNVSFTIENTTFINWNNTSALRYYGETCGLSVHNNLTLRNCVISNNVGQPNLKLFHISLNNIECIGLSSLQQLYYLQQHNNIKFIDCRFQNNVNMSSIIHVSPANSRATTGYFYLWRNVFHNNRNTHFLIMKSKTDSIWQISNYVSISKTRITSNIHNEGENLMSFTNSWVKFSGPITIMHNSYYTNLAKFHLSSTTLQYNITIYNNTARQIMSGTFVFIKENTTFNLTGNTVYILLNNMRTYSMNSEPICTVQFYSTLDNYNPSKMSVHVIISHNVHMNSKYVPNYKYDCRWLAGNVFQKAGLDAKSVYRKLLQITDNTVISKDKKRHIPSSICSCTKPTSESSMAYNISCYSQHLGSIFPGETLKVDLILQNQWLYHNFSMPIVVENTLDDHCSVLDISQMSQSHFNHDCNTYSYTLWPKDGTIKMCKLFIGLPSMPEMFYVQLKPCPLGFTLQESRKSCYCDPALANNEVVPIESCKLVDETILRPAYSWISVTLDTNTNNITYVVSSYCPFEHCLPYQSYLKLSNPDSQCQLNRAGLLCGKCQQGLSVVFGSLKCQQCSNTYLLLIIPITIGGIVFVTLLYIFNLTVRNGTVNTCIFYVNILNINILLLFPNCKSFTCMMLSYMNFDFRTRSCFYNGMDDYAKEWLHLALPFYLISIAIVLIILSRYSVRIQRLTAKKALPVLATLFLYSYTKILITVCNVLFRYSRITHLPDNKIELVWSISATTPLFGVKFLALFIVCIILFLMLFPFNLVLLFTRTLSCLRLISTFKPILDTYFGPYKDNAFYWTGLLLLIRVIVYILSVTDEDISSIGVPAVLGGLLCLHAAVQPFKSKFHNIQECATILNLLVVHSSLSYKKTSVGLKVATWLIAIGVVYFMVAITLYCIMYRWKIFIYESIKWLYCKMQEVKFIKRLHSNIHMYKANTLYKGHSIEMKSVSIEDDIHNYEEFQEPLIALQLDE